MTCCLWKHSLEHGHSVMKNDMASPIPTEGSPEESHDPKERTITDAVSVKPESPLADQFRQQTRAEVEAVKETADGERNPDFDQESIHGLSGASGGCWKRPEPHREFQALDALRTCISKQGCPKIRTPQQR